VARLKRLLQHEIGNDMYNEGSKILEVDESCDKVSPRAGEANMHNYGPVIRFQPDFGSAIQLELLLLV